jgi:hypothetical protein
MVMIHENQILMMTRSVSDFSAAFCCLNQNNVISFVTTYNPRDNNIFHFMKQIEFNLNSSKRMKNVLQKKRRL